MTIIEVSFGKTINIGNYESIRIDLKATVNKEEDYRTNLEKLKKLVANEENKLKSL